jgi:glycosyltransferase involved in cell wall biosynthesis
MPAPLVSVLITVYNREKYLAAAIESVLAQTFGDFELLIVDDNSKDQSIEIARRYEGDRVKVHTNERNLGDYANRNKAASLARGKYLKYVDADDRIYPHCLEMMVEAMEAFPEAGLGVSRSIPGVVRPVRLSPRDAYLEHFVGAGLLAAGPLAVIVRRSAFEAIGGFDTARHTPDTRCWLTLARKGPVAIMAPGLYWWRRHDEQESIAETRGYEAIAEVTGRRFNDVIEALDASDCPLSETERKVIRSHAFRSYTRGVLGQLRRGKFRYAKALVRQSRQPTASLAKSFVPFSRPRQPMSALRPQLSGGFALSHLPPRDRPPVIEHRPATANLHLSPLVSVLIPADNAEAHIAGAIESVLTQRFTDWELIIVDDTSRDLTAQIAHTYADGKRIRLFHNQHTVGKWPLANRCAEYARGKYLKFLYAEDRLYPHCLQQMVEMLNLHPHSHMLLSLAVNRFYCPVWLSAAAAYRQEYFGLMPLAEHPGLFLYRREEWQSGGGFKSDHSCPDLEAHFRMAADGGLVIAHTGLVCCGTPSVQATHFHSRGDTLSAEVIGYHLTALSGMTLPLGQAEIRQARNRWLTFAARQWFLRATKADLVGASAIYRMFGKEVLRIGRWKQQVFEANAAFWAQYYNSCGSDNVATQRVLLSEPECPL